MRRSRGALRPTGRGLTPPILNNSLCRRPRISSRWPKPYATAPEWREDKAGRKRGRKMPGKNLMPALSPTMTEGQLAKWLAQAGDEVNSGDGKNGRASCRGRGVQYDENAVGDGKLKKK